MANGADFLFDSTMRFPVEFRPTFNQALIGGLVKFLVEDSKLMTNDQFNEIVKQSVAKSMKFHGAPAKLLEPFEDKIC